MKEVRYKAKRSAQASVVHLKDKFTVNNRKMALSNSIRAQKVASTLIVSHLMAHL